MGMRYQIVEEAAGEGGFGKIDKAKDTELDRYVAIKTLDPLFTIGSNTEDIKRFRREARTLASLTHPNIPAIYDISFIKEEGDFKIIFEWVEGTTIRDFLIERGRFSLDEARRWFSNICSALEHAHKKGIIHRDIKPSNLIITANLESCYLVDFGIALNSKDIESLTGSAVIGTPGYMSPEQERGEELEPSSDLWSLGIVLYECLAGSRPVIGEYSPLSALNEAIPPSIDDLIRDCLADSEGRIISSKSFIDRLGEALKPSASFAKVLSDGALSEIQTGLNQMEADEFANLPSGQRILLMTRMNDLIRVDKPELRFAVVSLLAELVRVACLTTGQEYEVVVKNALKYGYLVQYTEHWIGDRHVREALNRVSVECNANAHNIIAKNVLLFIEEDDEFKSREKWYYHEMRNHLQNLLANSACNDDIAPELGNKLEEVNELSHSSARESLIETE